MTRADASPPSSVPARRPVPWRTVVVPALLTVALSVAAWVLCLLPLAERLGTGPNASSPLSKDAGPIVVRLIVRLLQAHVVVAVVLAILAAGLFGLVRQRIHTRTGAALIYWLLWLAITGYVTARFLITKPVFFEPLLYAPGGVTRALMCGLTDHLSPGLLDLAAGVAGLALLAIHLHDAAGWKPRIRTIAAVLLATAIVLGGPALTRPTPHAADPDRPNVLIIGVESLRADAVSGFGSPRKTTPHLDHLLTRSTAFSNALVPLARTLPSWSSLLTGAYPHTHGHRHMFPDEAEQPIHVDTLPRRLKQHGYDTAAVSDYAGEFFNLVDYGFDRVDAPSATSLDLVLARELLLADPFLLPFLDNVAGRAAFPVLDYLPSNAAPRPLGRRVAGWLGRLKPPFLLCAFISTPHIPYAAPYPFYRAFGDRDYEGPNKYAYHVRSLQDMKEAETRPPLAEQQRIRDLYDGAVLGADTAIGMILEALEATGQADRTVVVVTGDHGERFFEGDATVGHGRTFRHGDAANRVPLVLAVGQRVKTTRPWPALRIDEPVSTVDLAPTLTDLLGVKPLASAEGESLRRWWDSTAPRPTPVFAETGLWLNSGLLFRDDPEALTYPPVEQLLRTDRRDRTTLVLREIHRDRMERAKHRMIRLGRWKLIFEPTRTGVRIRLHDTVADPENRHDLAGQKPEIVRDLLRRLHEWMEAAPGRAIDERGHLVRRFTYFEG